MKPIVPHAPFIVAVAAFLASSLPLSAQPPGPGGKELPDDFRSVIHALFADHDQVVRNVEMTETGYRAVTTSEVAAVAARLQTHVAQMHERLESGRGVRRWDPAFAEMREHYEDLEMRITSVEKGVSAEVVGKTPEAIAVAQNHARIVSGFVEEGEARMHRKHPAVLASPSVAAAQEEGEPEGFRRGCAGEKAGTGEAGEGCRDAECDRGGKKGGCGAENTGGGGCCAEKSAAEEPSAEAIEAVREKGRAAAGALIQSLGGQLKGALAAGGPVSAIQVCRQVALPLTEATGKSLEGVEIRRTTLKPRNPANAPDAVDRSVLETVASAESLPEEVVRWVDGRARYYKPLPIQEVCLKCHGDPKTFPAELSATLRELYPDDEATGYALGDLRGVVRVDIVEP